MLFNLCSKRRSTVGAAVVLSLVTAADGVPVHITKSTGEMVAFDVSKPLRQIPAGNGGVSIQGEQSIFSSGVDDEAVEAIDLGSRGHPIIGADGRRPGDPGTVFRPDGALDNGMYGSKGGVDGSPVGSLDDPTFVFEGLSADSNRELFNFTFTPPDTVGDVGQYQYVQMTNNAIAVFNKADGSVAAGPLRIGDLWRDFAIEDCAKPNGDPIVVYDQLEGRWILTQFTVGCADEPGKPCFNCIAVSQTEDATGRYNRYAFPSQQEPNGPVGATVFPDYPKWGVWGDSYILTTRDFNNYQPRGTGFGVSVYAIQKSAVIKGEKNAPYIRFSVAQCEGCPGTTYIPEYLINDGLLPPDIDGMTPPPNGAPAPLMGTVDADLDWGYDTWIGFDAVNIWEMSVDWSAGTGSLDYVSATATAPFNSIFSGTRQEVPQPGVDNSTDYLDSLSSKSLYRLAYRNENDFESMLFSQAVVVEEGPPYKFGVRWYELRRIQGAYKIYQQGTYSPPDPTSRWMSSLAKDKNGNIALGFSVSDAYSVFPGIRITGRMAGDELGKMTLGEATVVDGGGAIINSFNRWGDYSSMNVDPVDDCTFWYTNEYIADTGRFNWKTKVTAFKLPGCTSSDDKKKKSKKGGVRK